MGSSKLPIGLVDHHAGLLADIGYYFDYPLGGYRLCSLQSIQLEYPPCPLGFGENSFQPLAKIGRHGQDFVTSALLALGIDSERRPPPREVHYKALFGLPA
ncbi:MAG: hypothetical protein ABSA77_03250 [Thermoguttaceae bacterium]